MNKELLTSNSEKTINKLRNVLNESKGMILDESILSKIDIICRNIETELKKEGIETEMSFKDHHLRIVYRGRRYHHRVDKPSARVAADVRLHPKIPLITLLGLGHLRIPTAASVLRRWRRIDDRRVYDGPLAQQQSLLRQILLSLPEQLRRQIVALQKMTELADRRLVWHSIGFQINPGKAAHRLHVVERILHRRIR